MCVCVNEYRGCPGEVRVDVDGLVGARPAELERDVMVGAHAGDLAAAAPQRVVEVVEHGRRTETVVAQGRREAEEEGPREEREHERAQGEHDGDPLAVAAQHTGARGGGSAYDEAEEEEQDEREREGQREDDEDLAGDEGRADVLRAGREVVPRHDAVLGVEALEVAVRVLAGHLDVHTLPRPLPREPPIDVNLGIACSGVGDVD